jgi:hypothetical protein
MHLVSWKVGLMGSVHAVSGLRTGYVFDLEGVALERLGVGDEVLATVGSAAVGSGAAALLVVRSAL